MTKTLEEIMQNFTSDEQAEIEAEADKLIAEEKAKREAICQQLQKHPYPYFVRDLKTRIEYNISKEQYNKLKQVHEKLIEVLFIEEKLDILLSNYFELEQDILNISLKDSIFYYEENKDNSFDELNLLDRRIINLLASCRMYIDQTAHSFSKIYGKESEEYIKLEGLTKAQGKEKIHIKKGIKNRIFDNNFSYRLIEQIRNYSQHSGLLVSKIIKNSPSINYIESYYTQYVTTIITKIKYLEDNSKFNKSILKELKDLEGEEFNLIKYIREYIGLIGNIHLEIREILKKDTEEWSNFCISLIEYYKQKTGNSYFSSIHCDINSSSIIEKEKVDLIQDIFVDRCKKLQEKNSELRLPYIATHYVSSKIN